MNTEQLFWNGITFKFYSSFGTHSICKQRALCTLPDVAHAVLVVVQNFQKSFPAMLENVEKENDIK